MNIDTQINGSSVTEEDINRWVKCAEKADFSEFKDASECIYGAIKPISEEKTIVSFSIPVSISEQLEALAKKQGSSKSDVIRAFIYDGLLSA